MRGYWNLPRSAVIATLVVFGVSLLANLFLVGWMAGRHVALPDRGPVPSSMLERLVATTPPAVRADMRARLGQNRGEIRKRVQAIRQARRGVAQALARPDFDPAEFERALAELRDATEQAQAGLHTVIAASARDVSPADRQAWARQWVRGPMTRLQATTE